MIAPLPMVDTRPLIREIDAALLDLLRSLAPDGWLRPAVGGWVVRDVAAHLLHGNVRRLSYDRDEPSPVGGTPAFDDLVTFLDTTNHEWTAVFRQVSRRLLIELLETTGSLVSDHFDRVDLGGPATFSLVWDGEPSSPAWLDIARDYTEKWHHQQQIRDATGRPGLAGPRYLVPLLSTLVRATQRAYGPVAAAPGTQVSIAIDDLDRCAWRLERGEAGWRIGLPDDGAPAAAIHLDADTARRFFMKQVAAREARARARAEGPPDLVDPFFTARAVLAR